MEACLLRIWWHTYVVALQRWLLLQSCLHPAVLDTLSQQTQELERPLLLVHKEGATHTQQQQQNPKHSQQAKVVVLRVL